MVEKHKILIVDDEFLVRQGVKFMIESTNKGYEIVGEASNGQEALDIIKQNPPNIVITDINMPKMDGIELCQRIQERFPNIKIVVLSNDSGFEYVKACFKFGVQDYILKSSLNPQELLEALDKINNNVNDYNTNDEFTHKISRVLLGIDNEFSHQFIAENFQYDMTNLFGINTIETCTTIKERSILSGNIIRNLTEMQKKINFKFYCIDFEKDILLFVLNFDNNISKQIKFEIKSLFRKIKNNFDEAFFVLTPSISAVNEIKNIYDLSFIYGLQQKFYYKDNAYYCEEEHQEKQVRKPIEIFDFKKFSYYSSSLQITQAIQFLKEYLAIAIDQKRLLALEIKTLVLNALYNIINNLANFNLDAPSIDLLKINSFTKIKNVKYAEELIISLDFIVDDFMSISTTCQKKFESYTIDQIINYVYDNYEKTLVLADVAKQFNMNYHYLSSYFSGHNKEGFNEFLNKVRIEKSIQLLKQNIPISYISSMVGYSEHSYFCKVFKKFTGVTPSNFRKNFLK